KSPRGSTERASWKSLVRNVLIPCHMKVMRAPEPCIQKCLDNPETGSHASACAGSPFPNHCSNCLSSSSCPAGRGSTLDSSGPPPPTGSGSSGFSGFTHTQARCSHGCLPSRACRGENGGNCEQIQ